MKIYLINQWSEWLHKDKLSWSSFNLICICFERDRACLDLTLDIIIIGFGFKLYYVTKLGKKYLAKMLEDSKRMEKI